MELSAEQVFWVGLIASAITYGLKLVAQWSGWKPGRGVLTVALYVVALVLGGLWSGVYVPQYNGDPVQWTAELLAMLGPIVGVATLIYNLLHARVIVPLSNRLLPKK
jgi:hypothetical protein